LIPHDFLDAVKTGTRVIVPFGRGNKTCEAYVLEVKNDSEYSSLKEIISIDDDYSYFDEKAVELVKFMVHRYFCSYISAIKAVMPSGVGTRFKKIIRLNDNLSEDNMNYISHYIRVSQIYNCLLQDGEMSYDKLLETVGNKNISSVINTMQKRGIITVEEVADEGLKDTLKKRVCLNIDFESASIAIEEMQKKAPARARCLEILCDESDMFLKDLAEYANTSKATIDALFKKGYVNIYEAVERENLFGIDYEEEFKKHVLNNDQQNVVNTVYDSIDKRQKITYLLNGVTGSGKTEVYLDLIEKTVSLKREAIFLVPEISLTPQMVRQVTARFGDRVAVMHSLLTQKQRFEQWKKINDGEVDIVVGARSAIFAPFKNIGLIIVDEEHENTYKSESSPKYSAIEIAKFRSRQHESVVILASATPLTESTFRAKSGKYVPLYMPKRVNNTSLPDTFIVDMREEMSLGNMGIFSQKLAYEISKNLDNNEQTILFLNRRGFSSFVSCRSCGYTPKCPNCNVSLTYHKSIDKMVCHYCDYNEPIPQTCPECSSKYIRHFGIGTQKVADEVLKIFPDARVIRMDADTTAGRQSHERLLSSFKNREADILIGTQMITKGLDFENVTLVGIVAADMSLNMDDYRASERTFDLITQVTGRAGRGSLKGRAVIQTYNPHSDTIIYAANQDYDSFYEEEIELRKLLIYPPFCEFINFLFTSETEANAKKTATAFQKELKNSTNDCNVIYYPVGQAPMYKLNGKYRYRFLIKTRYSQKLYDNIAFVYKKFIHKKGCSTISIDVNPTNMY
jgi:primosomal protein N' (replication factor Y)